MVKITPSPENQASFIKSAKDIRAEQERMQDILLLLENLIQREEITAKLILDCLYDVGSINLINRKVPQRSVNRMAKWIAKRSKPLFRIVALRWFKRNSPRLIANWLYSQVKFERLNAVKAAVTPPEPATSSALVPFNAPAALQNCSQEILRLRSQVKLLATMLIGVCLTLGGAVVWLLHKPQPEALQLSQSLQAKVVEQALQTEPSLLH